MPLKENIIPFYQNIAKGAYREAMLYVQASIAASSSQDTIGNMISLTNTPGRCAGRRRGHPRAGG